MSRNRKAGGQALIEFSLVVPLLFLLIVNVVNFGTFCYAWITVSNGARAGAQYLTYGPVAVGHLVLPAAPAVQTLVANDIQMLPNASTAQVCVSYSNSATVSCNRGTAPAGTPPAADTGEGTPAIVYPVGAVDVTYTYSPMIPLWDFGRLGIHATLPATTMHRQARMRILQ
jgi:Flp pilus assembly protein TadG